MEMSAKTVEAAVQAACEALGVDRDDINVSYEVLEFPTRKLFKTIPAKVLVKVEEPEAEKPAEVSTKPAEVVEISDETAPEIQKEVVEDMVEEAELAPVPGEEVEVPLDIDADPRLQAAVDYLTPIFNLMGVENFTFTAVKKGAATVLKVSGEHMGALIGRRGETMESLSYLASLVVNRMEGPYVKLGLDVGGYRNKREDDLSALARRIADRVIRTGCYYEMEPMNPYERHIIHTAIAEIDGVRSESKGDGPARHVVLYSTDPDACNLPDRDNARNQRASALTHHDQSRRRQRVDLDKDEGGEHIVGINQRNQGEHHQIRQDTINIVLGRLDLLLGFAHAAEESEQNDQQEHRQRNRFQYADANLIAPRRGEVTHLVGVAVARLQGVNHHADIHRQIRKDEEQRRPARHPAAHHGAGDRAHQRQQNTEEGEVLNELHVIPPPFPQGQ